MKQPTNTQLYVKLVAQFQRAFDQPSFASTRKTRSKILNLRGDLIEEELNEMREGIKANDKVAILDGMADLAYVVAGTMVTCNILPIPFTATKHRDDFGLITTQALNIIDECYLMIPCHQRMTNACNACLIAIDSVGLKYFKFLEAFRAVHENNMKKLWTELPTKGSGLTAKKVGEGQYLVRNAAGKVTKPTNHQPPNLESFIIS